MYFFEKETCLTPGHAHNLYIQINLKHNCIYHKKVFNRMKTHKLEYMVLNLANLFIFS